MEYQKALLKRLLEMIEINEKENILYKSVMKKLPSYNWEGDNSYFNAMFNKLNENEKRAYYNSGKRYSNSAIKRVRIELNKAFLENNL